jgi:hypothetical protein
MGATNSTVRGEWKNLAFCLFISVVSDVFKPQPSLNHFLGGKRQWKLNIPLDLCLELSVPPGTKPHTTSRQIWRLSNPWATGSEIPVSAVIHR